MSGVGQVFVGGGALPAVRVDVNPTVLNGYGLSLEDVRSFLSSANANEPKGFIVGAQRTWALNTTDQLFKAERLSSAGAELPATAARVRLSDVATVTDSVEDVRNVGYFNGKPAVLLIIFRQPGANIIDTVDRDPGAAAAAAAPRFLPNDAVVGHPGSHDHHPRLGARRRDDA